MNTLVAFLSASTVVLMLLIVLIKINGWQFRRWARSLHLQVVCYDPPIPPNVPQYRLYGDALNAPQGAAIGYTTEPELYIGYFDGCSLNLYLASKVIAGGISVTIDDWLKQKPKIHRLADSELAEHVFLGFPLHEWKRRIQIMESVD